MDFIGKEILSGELIPVLLGVSPEANQTARRFFRTYGVVSHLFCNKIPLTMRLTYCIKFHPIKNSTDRLMLTALKDFAEQLGHADVILYLIPCTVDYANFIWQNQTELERYYVLADQPQMDRVWYGEAPVQKEDRT